MFELISYDIFKDNNRYFIKIVIRNSSENFCDSLVTLDDSIFGQCTKFITLSFEPNSTLWVSWDLNQVNPSEETRGLQLSSLWGANLKISINGEIINADAMQVYRHLDIITNKVPESDQEGIPHHLMNMIDINDEYSVRQFVVDADRTIK